MSDSTYLLIPFAASSSDGCRETLRRPALPHLEKLLARLTVTQTDTGAEDALSPPHEGALALAYGLAVLSTAGLSQALFTVAAGRRMPAAGQGTLIAGHGTDAPAS